MGQHYPYDGGKSFTQWRITSKSPGKTDGQKQCGTFPRITMNKWIAERPVYAEEYKKTTRTSSCRVFAILSPYLVPEPWHYYDTRKNNLPCLKEANMKKNPPHFKMTQLEIPTFFCLTKNTRQRDTRFSIHTSA
jgi:hypothetical protein